ncbi:MAG TPA: hypothetical protein DD381_09240 [Lentisphaeria bacterium]|nr:MAG: hypothetical protein A2X47_13565 [Lentisphaerae bacterium GWF2_38_69]HBM16507.1 hypothetical protein [Lentisphaeria bacterium]
MQNIKILRALFLCSVLVVSSCSSVQVTSEVKPDNSPDIKADGTKFYIEGISYSNEESFVYKNKVGEKATDRFKNDLEALIRKECQSMYPQLFTDDYSNAIPLWVNIKQSTDVNELKSFLWFLCTAGICGIILPVNGSKDDSFAIQAGIWNGRDGIRGSSLNNDIQMHSEFLSSWNPTALVGISGESDYPEYSGFDQGLEEYYLDVSAKLVSSALAKLIMSRDSTFWAKYTGGNSYREIPSALQPSLNIQTPKDMQNSMPRTDEEPF